MIDVVDAVQSMPPSVRYSLDADYAFFIVDVVLAVHLMYPSVRDGLEAEHAFFIVVNEPENSDQSRTLVSHTLHTTLAPALSSAFIFSFPQASSIA